MKIVAFTGMPFSGKSEAVSIAKKRGYTVIRMGDLVWEETKQQGLELNDQNVGHIATKMRISQGNDIWAQRTVNKIRACMNSPILIIDGIRNHKEVHYFKQKLSKEFILIAIQTNKSLRYKRAMNRGRIDDSLSLQKIQVRDQREISWGLDKVIKAADHTITNNLGINEFRNKINDFFNSLEKR